MAVNLKEILKGIKQELPKVVDKTSIEPYYKPLLVRQEFISILNQYCLQSSDGKRGLELDVETEKAIELICMYFNNEKEFEDLGYSLKKGIWLCGNFGTGKTQLMKTYKYLMDNRNVNHKNVGFQSCVDMNMRFLKKDEFTNKIAKFDGINVFSNKKDKTERIFDDLGEEETTVMDFGNKVCIMAHILSERYKGINNGCVTHITTNLSNSQITEIYGGRIESRMNEMFNVIKLGSKIDSKDYRK